MRGRPLLLPGFTADNRAGGFPAGAARAGDPRRAERLVRSAVAGFPASG